MPLTLSTSRLYSVLVEWLCVSIEQPEICFVKSQNNRGEEVPPTLINSLLILSGTEIDQINQRAVGLLHYLLRGPVNTNKRPPKNVCMLITRTHATMPQLTSEELRSGVKLEEINSYIKQNVSVLIINAGEDNSSVVRDDQNGVISPESVVTPKNFVIYNSIDEGIGALRAAVEKLPEICENGYIGIALREIPIQQGDFASKIRKVLESLCNDRIAKVNAAQLFSSLTHIKDAEGEKSILKAAQLGMVILRNYVVPTLTDVCNRFYKPDGHHGFSVSDSTASITSQAVSNVISGYLDAPNTLGGKFVNMSDANEFGIALVPQVLNASFAPGHNAQGHYDVNLTNTNLNTFEHNLLGADESTSIVIARYGGKYLEQCVYMARTFFFFDGQKEDGPCKKMPRVEEFYRFALKLTEKIAAELVAAGESGTPLLHVYNAVLAYAKAENADATEKYLVKDSLGFLTGPILLENRSTIGEKAAIKVRKGMAFVVRVVLRGLPTAMAPEVKLDGEETKPNIATYSIEIADTIIVNDGNLTKKTPRAFSEVIIPIQSELEAEEDAAHEEQEGAHSHRVLTRNATGSYVDTEGQRQEIQSKLWDIKEAYSERETKRNHNAVDPSEKLSVIGRLTHDEIQCCASRAAIPANLKQFDANDDSMHKIFIHNDTTAWLPFFGGRYAPFHVSTINKTEVKEEGVQGYTITITFGSMQESYLPYKNNRAKIFVKELKYHSLSPEPFDGFARQLLKIKANIKDQDLRMKNEKGVVKQNGVGIHGNPIGVLRSVKIRPAPNTKEGSKGDLEVCDNGFRFKMLGQPPVEILYNNVKHIICQPSHNDIRTIFHVTLERPMLLGGPAAGARTAAKTVTEIQFCAEVMETSESVIGRKKTYEQELQEERRETERIQRTNVEFLEFAKKIRNTHISNVFAPRSSVDFDARSPIGRSKQRFRASKECLWCVSEPPFYTIALKDIEIVILERVAAGVQDFDMALVPHNYKQAYSISTIPMDRLDQLKQWLCEADMIYIETTVNLNYPQLLKAIAADPEWNPWSEDGWKTLVQGDDEEEEDSDSDVEGDEDEEEEEEEEEESDLESSVDSSDISDDEEDEEEGSEDWDEMEKRAREEDKDIESSDGDERPRKKRR